MERLASIKPSISLITGGSSGIGRAVADQLRARGHEVITAQRRDGDIHIDLSTSRGAEELWQSALALAPAPPTLVVLNAGVCRQGAIDLLPPEAFYETFQLNLITPLLIARDAIASWRNLGLEGHLVFVASQAGLPGAAPVGEAIYAASKAGLLGAVRALASECGPTIRINAVAPGNVRTRSEVELLRRAAQATGQSPGKLYNQVAVGTPIGRWLRPIEIARAILFLHDSTGMTGEILTVTGGGYAVPRSSAL